MAEFLTLDGFHRRRLQPGEPLSVYMHKLLDRAMPGQERPARDQLLLHQFVTGLPDAISRQLRAAGETRELEKAVERVRLLLTIQDQEQTAAIIATEKSEYSASELEMLREQVTALTEQVATLTTSNRRSSREQQRPRSRRCFGCNQTGHVLRDSRGPEYSSLGAVSLVVK